MANLYLPGSLPCLILNFPPHYMTPSSWDIKPVASSILSVAVSMQVPSSQLFLDIYHSHGSGLSPRVLKPPVADPVPSAAHVGPSLRT